MTTNIEPHQTLLAMASLTRPAAIRAAATLELADHIAAGAGHPADLADRTETHADVLDIVLRYLVDLGILTRGRNGGFELTELGSLLRSDHETSMRPMLNTEGMIGRQDIAQVDLVHTLRTGEPAHVGMFGRGYWESVNEGPEFIESLDMFDPTGELPATMDANIVVDHYDWSRVGRVVDVGGHTAAMLIRLLRRYPELHGTVLDLANSVEIATRNLTKAGLTGRAEAVVGDFFEPLPVDGDVYLVSAILADWSDADAIAILRRLAEAAGTHGKVLLAEVSLPSAAAETQLWLRATMPAPVRSTDEVIALATEAGLRLTWQGPATPLRSLLEFVAAGSDAGQTGGSGGEAA